MRVGAGPSSTTLPLFHHNDLGSYTFKVTTDFAAVGQSEVSVFRIEDICSSVAPGRTPDILKLDCEGWDLEVLSGVGDLVGVIDCIFIEAGVANSNFQDNSLANVLLALADYGFCPIDVQDAARSSRTQVMWNAEVCFVRRGSDLFKRATSIY